MENLIISLALVVSLLLIGYLYHLVFDLSKRVYVLEKYCKHLDAFLISIPEEGEAHAR